MEDAGCPSFAFSSLFWCSDRYSEDVAPRIANIARQLLDLGK
jgi:hypothetical protein